MRGTMLAVMALTVAAAAPLYAASEQGRSWCGTRADAARDAVWAHREEMARREARGVGRAGGARPSAAAPSEDVGEIAVLYDEGDLALLRNPFDLAGAGLQWTPQGEGFSVSRVDRPVAAASGRPLPLGDDDTTEVTLPFAFPFFGRSYTSAWINSDGNLTFGAGDSESTARTLGRLVSGPPRVAPLLADLDPSAGGSVTFASATDNVSVTWTGVPQYGESDKNTLQVTLWRDGRIDFAWDAAVSASIAEGVVGVAPGAERGGFTGADLSGAAAVAGGAALAESFRDTDTLDVAAVGRKFYLTHPDDYQQLVVYTSRRVIESGTFAYQLTVRATERGTGQRAVDFGAEFGSPARLESFVDMDAWSKYRDDLERAFLGEDSTLSVLAHEVGHRWLAHARYLDAGASTGDLLGRQEAHWSFFAHTSGSHMEGNDIEDLGGGRFRTRAASQRYSPLDQYLMGLRAPEEVPPFFVVRSPTDIAVDPARDPQRDVLFGGTRKDVAIADVVAALGPREPASGGARTGFRQAFVYVTLEGTADPAALARIEKIRAAFPAFFERSTEGRGSVANPLR